MVPQLLASLASSTSASTRLQLQQLLISLADVAPHVLLYPLVADERVRQQNVQLLLADVEGRQGRSDGIPPSEMKGTVDGQAGSARGCSRDLPAEKGSVGNIETDDASVEEAKKSAEMGAQQAMCLSCDALAAVTPGWTEVMDVVGRLVRG